MKLADYGVTLDKLAFMASLGTELRSKVTDVFDEVGSLRAAERGMVWLREGEHTPNKGYVLLKGTVKIRKSEHPDFTCEAPELLGEIMQFSNTGLRTATVCAATDCILMRFMWDAFWEACETKLSEAECKEVRAAIENCAWSHFAD